VIAPSASRLLAASSGAVLCCLVLLQGCGGSPTYSRMLPDAGGPDVAGPGTGGHSTGTGGGTAGTTGAGSGGALGEGGAGGLDGTGGGPAGSGGGDGNGGVGGGAASGSGGAAGGPATSSGGSGAGGTAGGAGGTAASSGGGGPGIGGAAAGGAGALGGAGGGAAGGRGGAPASGGRGGGGAGGATGPLVYDCSTSVAPANNLLTDFAGGSGVNGRWTSTNGMSGVTFAYRGGASTASTETAATVHNLHLTATVLPGSYAGAGINFDACTTFGSNKSVRFTVAGSTSCSVELQLQTYRRKPSTDIPAGGCVDDGTTTCGAYAHLSNLSLSPSPVTVALTSLADWIPAAATQVVGIQWQLTNPNNNNCTADLHFDDITLVP